ncbi:MAG: ABC transporter substrate-binding protein [Pseudomonadota bacterium]
MKTSLLTSAIALCVLGTQAYAEATSYPLTLENCGHTITFDSAPDPTVTVGQSTTEILYLLGVGDSIVGTSVWFNPVLDQFKDLNDGIERIADNDPSFESVVNKKPELVTVMFEWHIGPEGYVATREQFHELDIPTYVMPTDCVAKDNTVGIDGTRSELFDTANLYRGIEELAMIYDVQDRGAELVAELKAREEAAIAKATSLNLGDDASAVFWFSSADVESDPYVAGQKGVSAFLMAKLGLTNVVEAEEEWPLVGWETIAQADPTLIVLAEMDRRRFPVDDINVKKGFLNSDPVVSEMTAVREDRVLAIPAHAMEPSVRTIYALEQIVEELSKASN